MKRTIGLVVAVVVVAGVAAVYAGGDDCCAAGKAQSAAGCTRGSMFGDLKLSAEQQTKLDALVKECQDAKGSAAAHEKFMDGVKSILTAEQYTQWTAACEKMPKSGTCPFNAKKDAEPAK